MLQVGYFWIAILVLIKLQFLLQNVLHPVETEYWILMVYFVVLNILCQRSTESVAWQKKILFFINKFKKFLLYTVHVNSIFKKKTEQLKQNKVQLETKNFPCLTRTTKLWIFDWKNGCKWCYKMLQESFQDIKNLPDTRSHH